MNVPKLRFKEFNYEWKSCKFYDVVTIKNGQVNPNDEKYRNLPHIGPGNIEKETGRLLEYNLAKEDKLISSKYLFSENDIIYGKINPHFAKVCFPKFRGLCSADTYPISPIKKYLIPNFLLYLLLNKRFTKFATSVSTRTGMPKINRDELGTYKFKIPTLQEQEKIGKLLSLLDKKIELQSKKIGVLKLYKKSLSTTVLNLNYSNKYYLKDIVYFKNGKGHEKIIDNNGNYILVNSKFISTNGKVIKKCNSQLVPLYTNDIVMVMSDLPNGKALAKCFYINEDNKYTLNQRICLLKAKPNINPKYLYYKINRNPYYLKFDDGINQTNLKKEDILNLQISIPNIKYQKIYSEILSLIDLKINTEYNKYNLLLNLKKGLMQKMFV